MDLWSFVERFSKQLETFNLRSSSLVINSKLMKISIIFSNLFLNAVFMTPPNPGVLREQCVAAYPTRKVLIVVKWYAKSSIKIQKLIEILIIENFQKNLYIFCLKVAVWVLPEARVQTAGSPYRALRNEW